MTSRSAEGLAADFAALVSGSGAAATWIVQVNGILQMVATGVAIAAGLYAIKWHKIRIAKERKANESKREST